MQGLLFARVLTTRTPEPTGNPAISRIWIGVVEVTTQPGTNVLTLRESIWWVEWRIPSERAEALAQRMRKGMFCAFRGEIRVTKRGPCLSVNGMRPGQIQILGHRTGYLMIPLSAMSHIEARGALHYQTAHHFLTRECMSNTDLERLGYAPATQASMKEDPS